MTWDTPRSVSMGVLLAFIAMGTTMFRKAMFCPLYGHYIRSAGTVPDLVSLGSV